MVENFNTARPTGGPVAARFLSVNNLNLVWVISSTKCLTNRSQQATKGSCNSHWRKVLHRVDFLQRNPCHWVGSNPHSDALSFCHHCSNHCFCHFLWLFSKLRDHWVPLSRRRHLEAIVSITQVGFLFERLTRASMGSAEKLLRAIRELSVYDSDQKSEVLRLVPEFSSSESLTNLDPVLSHTAWGGK